MESLKWLREQGELMNREDRAELLNLTLKESRKILERLADTTPSIAQVVETMYRVEHETDLAELQARLFRIGQWEKRRDREAAKLRKTKTK